MPRPLLPLAVLATALFGAGCGAEAGEDAPPIATGVVLAQAPPNAVGADVPRPTNPAAPPTSTRPSPMKIPPAPHHPGGPLDPLPQTGGTTPKGTEL